MSKIRRVYPRPRKFRRVLCVPLTVYFKPRGVPLTELEEACLMLEAVEALRLVDAQGMSMSTAALHMGVSRHTLGRIVAEARAIVADALVHGKALHITGGTFALPPEEPEARAAQQPQPMAETPPAEAE